MVDSSVHAGVSTISGVDYVDLREDRAVFFATVPVYALEINYQIKSCNRGEFVVPPVFAESMYERNVKGRGVGGKITRHRMNTELRAMSGSTRVPRQGMAGANARAIAFLAALAAQPPGSRCRSRRCSMASPFRNACAIATGRCSASR